MGLSVEMFYECEEIFEVKCTICLNVFESPRKLSNCRHHYCRRCIIEWLEDSEECPQCRTIGEIAQPTDEVVETINNLPAKCYYQALGCRERVPFGQLHIHVRRCQFRMVQCPRRCGMILPVIRMATHILTCVSGIDPLLERLMCFRCAYIYANGDFPSHCDFYEIARNVWRHRRRMNRDNENAE